MYIFIHFNSGPSAMNEYNYGTYEDIFQDTKSWKWSSNKWRHAILDPFPHRHPF